MIAKGWRIFPNNTYGGVFIDKYYGGEGAYLWKESKESDITVVRDRRDEILYKGKVPKLVVVIGVVDNNSDKNEYKTRKINCDDIRQVFEYFRLLGLRDSSVEEQEEYGFTFWNNCYNDPMYKPRSKTKIKAMMKKHKYKIIKLYRV